jgi:hypothetical protein
MLMRNRFITTAAASLYAAAFALAQDTPLTPEQIAAAARTDEFSIPTPGEFMAAMSKIGKPDWSAKERPAIATTFQSRAQLALNLGTLVADGYVAVESENKQTVKNIGKDIIAMSKSLGVQERIIERGKSLAEFADNGQWDVLREELEATQNEVKVKMAASGDDKDLIALVTTGAWVRGTEVVASLVAGKYTPEGAKLLRQPAILEFLISKLEVLPEKWRDDPAVKRCRVKLVELKTAVSFSPDAPPDKAAVANIHKLAAELVKDLSNTKLK